MFFWDFVQTGDEYFANEYIIITHGQCGRCKADPCSKIKVFRDHNTSSIYNRVNYNHYLTSQHIIMHWPSAENKDIRLLYIYFAVMYVGFTIPLYKDHHILTTLILYIVPTLAKPTRNCMHIPRNVRAPSIVHALNHICCITPVGRGRSTVCWQFTKPHLLCVLFRCYLWNSCL